MYAKLHSRKGNLLIRLIITAFLVFWAAVQIYPLIWLVFFSFKSNEEFWRKYCRPPLVWKVENYKNALMVEMFFAIFLIAFGCLWLLLLLRVFNCNTAYALSRMSGN